MSESGLMAMCPGLVNKRRLELPGRTWCGKETGTPAFQAEGRRFDPGLPLHLIDQGDQTDNQAIGIRSSRAALLYSGDGGGQ